MSIPLADQKHVELQMIGSCAAPGAVTKAMELVFNFRRTAVVNPVVKVNIQTAFQASIGAAILAAANEDYTQSANKVRIIDDALDSFSSSAQAGVGAIAGDRLPTYCAICFPMQTGVRGRFAQGSKHVGPVTESDTLNDILTGAAVTRWTAVATAIQAGFTDADGNIWVPAVVSRKYSTLNANPTTVISNDVISTLLNLNVGRLSRRKQKTVR